MSYTKFTVRKTKPVASDKYIKCYNNTDAGGWSWAVEGSPVDPDCNVLANCVGYAQGRFCEIYDEITGTTGNKYRYLNCNAENFVERAEKKYPELEMGVDPRPGAIMCWQRGTTSGSDGAGHVAVVEEVIDNDTILTSESGYGMSVPFYTKTRTRGAGNWGLKSPYAFRCFIYNPVVEKIEDVTPPVERNEFVDQIRALIEGGQYVRSGAGVSNSVVGMAKAGYYNYSATAEADHYQWYQIADGQWVAGVPGRVEVLPKKEMYDISVSVSHGSAVVSPSSAYPGTTVTISVEPDIGYEVVDVKIDGEELTGDTFVMPDHAPSIVATTQEKKYIITWVVDGQKTTEVYKYGEMPEFKGSTDKDPDEHYSYVFAGWSPQVARVADAAAYVAQYTTSEIVYTIETKEAKHGKFVVDKVVAAPGEEVSVAVVPDTNYAFDYLIVNQKKVDSLVFAMPDNNIVITVVFKQVMFNLFKTVTDNGTYKLSAEQAAPGTRVLIFYYPDKGYELDTSSVNGVIIDGDGFTMPDRDALVRVSFKQVSWVSRLLRKLWELIKAIFDKNKTEQK